MSEPISNNCLLSQSTLNPNALILSAPQHSMCFSVRPPVFCMIFDKMIFLIDPNVGVSNLWARHLPSKHLSRLSNYWPLKVKLGSVSSIFHSEWDKRHLLLSEASTCSHFTQSHSKPIENLFSQIFLEMYWSVKGPILR